MALSPEKKSEVSEVIEDWNDISEYIYDASIPYDWRSRAVKAMEVCNVKKMKQDAAPLAELKVLDLMQRSSSEAIQLDAAKYVLAQAGHGPIQKVDHNIVYEKMEPNQLVSILQSKITQIKELAPHLLLDLPAIEADIVEETSGSETEEE